MQIVGVEFNYAAWRTERFVIWIVLVVLVWLTQITATELIRKIRFVCDESTHCRYIESTSEQGKEAFVL